MEKLTFKKPQTADGTAIEPTARWIRVKFGGEIIADSTRAILTVASRGWQDRGTSAARGTCHAARTSLDPHRGS